MAQVTYKVELLGAGSTFFDITQYVKSVSISRGRSRELDKFEAGQFSVTLLNRNRYFDPLYTSSPYYGYIVPRRQVRITVNSVRIFTGYVTDWSLSYNVSGESIATMNGFDAFLFLSNQTLPEISNTATTSGTRIYNLATYTSISWPGGSLNINAGLRTLQADLIAADTNTLDYFQTCERSERGYLFINASNVLTYYNYAGSGSPAPTISPIVFSDTGQTPYQEISVVYGSELLYNTVTLSRNSGGTATQSDAASITAYGDSTYSDSGLFLDSDTDLDNQALLILGKYSQPEYRFDTISVILNPLGSITQSYLLAIELADIVKVIYTPNQVGSAITKYVRVIGIDHRLEVDRHTISFRFADLAGDTFILDSAAFGQLDLNSLGF